MKPIELDGTTGEGGGQLVRIAVAVAAVTSQPVKITNIRGNRPSKGGGGLKSQHFTSIAWLAKAVDAQVEGLEVGSRTLTFIPRRPPTQLIGRKFEINAESEAASSLLILQAVFPFVLFASAGTGDPIELEVSGGSNVSFSPSFEYFDQALMPTLEERFGIKVERELRGRGWSLGPKSRGSIWCRVHPVPRAAALLFRQPQPYKYPESYEVTSVNVSMVIPMASHEKMQQDLVRNLGTAFPDAEVNFKLVEDSQSDARWSVLLVATSSAGIRWGKDVLSSLSKKATSRDTFVALLAKKLCRELFEEVEIGGQVDGHLQDQLIVFQALCEGSSSFPRGEGPALDDVGSDNGRMRREKTHEPFGHGSLHAQTARWVVGAMMPKAEFYNKGDVVKGVGLCFQ